MLRLGEIRAGRAIGIEPAAIIFPGNVVGAQHIADALLHRRRNDEPGLRQSFGRKGWVDVDGLPILIGPALCL